MFTTAILLFLFAPLIVIGLVLGMFAWTVLLISLIDRFFR